MTESTSANTCGECQDDEYCYENTETPGTFLCIKKEKQYDEKIAEKSGLGRLFCYGQRDGQSEVAGGTQGRSACGRC